MNTIKAVLFDMDGVLVDSEPLHAKSWERVLIPLGFAPGMDWFIDWVGIPDHDLALHLFDEKGLGESVEDLLDKKREVYWQLVIDELGARDGVAAGLANIRPLPVAVVTSTGTLAARHTMENTGLAKYFDIIVSCDDVERRKPFPDPYLLAAEKLGVNPENCVVIEDSPAGMKSGRAAGCTVLGVRVEYGANEFADADHIFDSTAEAIDWVKARLK